MVARLQKRLSATRPRLWSTGAGTGKSYAILAAALDWLAADPRHKVVISTYTKQLQSQLAADIEALSADALPALASAADMVKGAANRLSLRSLLLALTELTEPDAAGSGRGRGGHSADRALPRPRDLPRPALHSARKRIEEWESRSVDRVNVPALSRRVLPATARALSGVVVAVGGRGLFRLAYLVGALGTGLIHQQNVGPSPSGLTVSAAQWIAGGFITMAAATAVAVLLTIIRWLMNRLAAPPRPPPQPESLALSGPTSRIVSPTGPVTDSWRRRPQPKAAPRPEPPSWPWPEEPAPRSKRASRREPPPPTEPFSRPRSSSWREPPLRPGPPSFGAPHDLTSDLTSTACRNGGRHSPGLPRLAGLRALSGFAPCQFRPYRGSPLWGQPLIGGPPLIRGQRRAVAQPRIMSMRARIWSAVACGSGGPPHARRRSAWMAPCGCPVR